MLQCGRDLGSMFNADVFIVLHNKMTDDVQTFSSDLKFDTMKMWNLVKK